MKKAIIAAFLLPVRLVFYILLIFFVLVASLLEEMQIGESFTPQTLVHSKQKGKIK